MKMKNEAKQAPEMIRTIHQAMKLPEGQYDYVHRNMAGMRVRAARKLNIIIGVPPIGSITEFIDKDGKRKKVILTTNGYRKVEK